MPLDTTTAHGHVDNQSAQIIHIESSRLLPMLMLIAVLSGTAIALAVLSMIRSTDASTDSRLLEYYILELDQKVTKAGIQAPEDSVAAKLQK